MNLADYCERNKIKRTSQVCSLIDNFTTAPIHLSYNVKSALNGFKKILEEYEVYINFDDINEENDNWMVVQECGTYKHYISISIDFDQKLTKHGILDKRYSHKLFVKMSMNCCRLYTC